MRNDEVYEHPALTALIAKREGEKIGSVVKVENKDRDAEKSVRFAINSHMQLLQKELREVGLMVIPIEPSKEMITASMATVTRSVKTMTKAEKHRRRLQAALTAHAVKTKVFE